MINIEIVINRHGLIKSSVRDVLSQTLSVLFLGVLT